MNRPPRGRPVSPLSRASVLLLLALILPAAGTASSEDFLLGGIQVNEPDVGQWLSGLEAAGMNTVSVTVYARQGDWDSDNLWWDEESPWVVREIEAAKHRGLRVVLILRVALDSAFERNRFLWHGMIMPKTDALLDGWFHRYSDFVLRWAKEAEALGVDVLGVGSELSALTSTLPVEGLPPLQAYYLDPDKQAERRAQNLAFTDRVDRQHLWARGKEEGYPTLAAYVDAEIAADRVWAAQVTFQDRTDPLRAYRQRQLRLAAAWRRLIREVRKVYSGSLTYAANFDQYREVGFWDELDLMGINAYFPLREGSEESGSGPSLLSSLVHGWTRILGHIDRFRHRLGVPHQQVLFTEIGYSRRARSTVQPWSGSGFSVVEEEEEGPELVVWDRLPTDLEERAMALRALRLALDPYHPPLLRGLLYWKLSTVPAHAEIEPFVVVLGHGDPALAELRAFRAGSVTVPSAR